MRGAAVDGGGTRSTRAARAPPPPLPPPLSSMPPCIDDFDVGQELGKGGFAVVYRARVRTTGLEVALKVVDKQRACEHLSGGGSNAAGGLGAGLELACARVANEVRLHWGLKHAAVVELLEFFEDERFVYLVLELCGGGDLYRRLRLEGPLGEREAKGYMGQLLAGLQYLHRSGVLHRDLKLSNLLLSEDGRRLRIADFGLAVKLEDEDSETHTMCGTPNYMAPEVQGEGYGLSADVWSAGCLFYTMVTGAAPFQGRRVGDTLANTKSGRYVVPEGLSASAKDFLACMLSLDPSRRMRVEEAAAHPFLRLDTTRTQRGQSIVAPASAQTLEEDSLPTAAAAAAAVVAATGTGGARRREGSSGCAEKKASSTYHQQPSPARSTTSKGGRISGESGERVGEGTTMAKGDATSAAAAATAAAAAAAGHSSTLTASTAGLGSSDLFSVTSSFLDGEDTASFTTLRAEAVPTPATIGEGAAAAAARVRHAAARAPFRTSAERDGAAVDARSAAAAAGRKSGSRREGGGSGGGEACRGVARRRRPTARPLLEEEEEDKFYDAAREWKATRVSVEERDDRAGGTEKQAGRDIGVHPATEDEEGDEGLEWRGSADASMRIRALKGGRNVSRSGERLAGPTDGLGNGRHQGDRESGLDLGQGQQRRHRQQPQPRRSRRSRLMRDSSHGQRHPHVAGTTGDRTGVAKPTERRGHFAGCNSGSNSSGCGSCARSSEHSSSRTPGAVPVSTSSRRRQREGGRGASRPPPPLPPQPPPPPPPRPRTSSPDEQIPPSSSPPHLQDFAELRSAAVAERRLHESPWAIAAKSRTGSANGCRGATAKGPALADPRAGAAGRKTASHAGESTLVPLSTNRVEPVSHRSGGQAAAAVEVFPDGRASITVGRRWLVSSGDGERVWAGGAKGGAAGARLGGKEAMDPGYALQSLPEAYRPLYRSLAGIVNALRSKTPKVVLRPTPCERPSSRAQPVEIVLCALMDNLPEPDFTAAFADGASLSLWTRKGELRVELPCGRVRRWAVTAGGEWPAMVDSPGESGGGGGVTGNRRSAVETAYLTAGFEGYCRCLGEEAAAYRRGASFPLELVAPGVKYGTAARSSSGRTQGVSKQSSETVSAEAAGSGTRTGRREEVAAAATIAGEHGGGRKQAHSEEAQHEDGLLCTGGDRAGSWWRGEEESSSGSDSSAAAREYQGRQESVDREARDGSRGWGGGDLDEDWSGNPSTTEPTRGHRVDRSEDVAVTEQGVASDRASRDQASGGRYVEPRQQQHGHHKHQHQHEKQHRSWQSHPPVIPETLRYQQALRTPLSTGIEADSRSSIPGALGVTRASAAPPRPVFMTDQRSAPPRDPADCVLRQQRRPLVTGIEGKSAKMGEESEEPCPDTSSLTCSSISEDLPASGTRSVRDLRTSGGGMDDRRERAASHRSGGGGKGGDRKPLHGRGRSAAAAIPGLGEAFRDGNGDLEVRFCDGVVVVVDAAAKWMRVERPPDPGEQRHHHRRHHHHQQQQQHPRQEQNPSNGALSHACGAAAVNGAIISTTYDLGRHAAARRRGSRRGRVGEEGGRAQEREQRIPRDVKERMKVLPRFIAVLKGTPTSTPDEKVAVGAAGAAF